MANITAAQVNELRKKTNIGMMECKRALVACNGDMEAAIEYLRKAGIVKAEEKAGRSAKQGIIVAQSTGTTGVMIEFLCETDFVAKTTEFKEYGAKLAEIALAYSEEGDVCEKLNAEVKEDLKAFIGKIKENMIIRRALHWTSRGAIAYYLHTATPYGAMVDVEGEYSDELLRTLPMHVTAFNPEFIDVKDIPADRMAKELEIAIAQVPADKPDIIKKNIAKGKLAKWESTVCLMKQPWVLNDKTCLAKFAPNLKVKRIVRWLAGEELPEDK